MAIYQSGGHSAYHSQGRGDEILVEDLGTAGAFDTVPISDGVGGLSMFLPPSARVRHSVDQAIMDSTDTALTFDTEDFDTDTIHDGANPTRLTAVTVGKYVIYGQVHWEGNTSKQRAIFIRLNGTTAISRVQSQATSDAVDPNRQMVATEFDLAVGDFVELIARQTSGGSLDVDAAGSESPVFGMAKLLG